MMANLFSSFDPSTNFNSTLNWMSTLLIFLFIPPTYWLIPSRWNFIWILIINTLHKEFKVLLKENSSKGSSLIFTSLFSLILFNNFLGLFPYIFTATSHLTLTLTLSLPLWLSFMIYNMIFNFMNMLAHLAPQGAPQILLPFLVIIETISNIIRPSTLAIRLSANMIAGHLLITLLSNSGSMINIPILSILILAQILLLILETAVSIIQAYVFSILMTLYSSEN
ncbi:ATP synthase F0 subunit 6 (mitochondrion) [Sitophilus oryzae]|uniref:ATP synthase subunit a n=1 Tax=Sitophilus oryzae TaxID=7048 RepID=A0A1B1UUL6_SITOR|nr:ATP synthase F0 subunit 6 [Sitophilus oryzae]ANW06524.1 ATP synthase F0 subunit 6 [Sitophilus oryzae]AQD17667.1 ATP synthase F0 subunit 6 [Sitophilus oryzae]